MQLFIFILFSIIMQITTARKAVTLLLSYLIFTKPLTEQHGSGLLLIAMGIVLKLVPDSKPSSNRVGISDSNARNERNHLKEVKKRIENGEVVQDEEKQSLVWNEFSDFFFSFLIYIVRPHSLYIFSQFTFSLYKELEVGKGLLNVNFMLRWDFCFNLTYV